MTATLLAWNEVKGSLPADAQYPDRSTRQGRLMIFFVLPMTLPLFGFAAFLLISGQSGAIPEAALDWIAISCGVSGLLTGVAQAIVYRGAVGPSFQNPVEWGRVITVSVLPESAVLFGFVTSFLALTAAGEFVGPASVLVEASRSAAFFASLGALGAPVAALLSLTAYDFRQETFLKGVNRATIGTVIMTIGFAAAYLTLGSL